MNPEVQILSEYLDGELPQDLRVRVEDRLRKDPKFKATYDKLVQLREALRSAKIPSAISISDETLALAKGRVWEKIERSIGRKTPGVNWFAKAKDFFRMSVSLPIPAFAAMLVVVLTIGVVAVARGGNGTGAAIAVADQNANVNLSTSSNIPTTVASGTPVSTGDLAMLAPTPGNIQGTTSGGVSVTIEVQNIRQLLALLEGSQGLNDMTIQVPQLQPVDEYGEPVLLRGSEVDRGNP